MQGVINDFNSGLIDGEGAAMAITNELGNLSEAEKNRVFLLARAGDEQAKSMANAITQFEQSADRMKKQGNTMEGVQKGFQVFNAVIMWLKGYFSQFKDMDFGQAISSIMGDIGTAMKDGMKKLIPWGEIAIIIGTAAAAAVVAGIAKAKISSMLVGGGGAASAGAGIGAGMKGMAGGLAAFANPAVALGLAAVTLAVIGLAGAFALASVGFEAFGNMMKSILEGAAPVVESFGIAIKSVFEGIGSVIESVGDSISGIVNSIGNVIEKYGEMKVGRINAEADAMVKTTEATTAAIQDLAELDPQNIMGLAMGISAMGTALESFAETMTPGFLDTIGQGFASLIGAESPVQAVIQLSNEADPVKIMEVAKATMATNAANAGATELDPSLSQSTTDNSSQNNTYNTTNNSGTSDTNIDVLETLNVLASQNDQQLEALKRSNRLLGEISNKQ